MPLGHYNVNNYIQSLLKRISVKFNDDDIILYSDMVNYSVGFNPRSMKRLFNSLLLLNLVAEKKNLFDEKGDAALKEEKQRILFGTLCLQAAYEPFYRYLQKNIKSIKQDVFESLKDENKLRSDESFAEIRKELNDPDGSLLRRLTQFMETFYDSVQLKSDTDKNVLSEKEVETIKELLSFSSLTSTDASTANINVDYDKRYKNRDMAYRLIQELNSKYADQLKQLNTKFAVYQGRKMSDVDIYLKIDVNNKMFNLEFWFGNELDNRAVDYMGLGQMPPTSSQELLLSIGSKLIFQIIFPMPNITIIKMTLLNCSRKNSKRVFL